MTISTMACGLMQLWSAVVLSNVVCLGMALFYMERCLLCSWSDAAQGPFSLCRARLAHAARLWRQHFYGMSCSCRLRTNSLMP